MKWVIFICIKYGNSIRNEIFLYTNLLQSYIYFKNIKKMLGILFINAETKEVPSIMNFSIPKFEWYLFEQYVL